MRLIVFMFKLAAWLITSMGKMLGGAVLLVVSTTSLASDEKKRQKYDI